MLPPTSEPTHFNFPSTIPDLIYLEGPVCSEAGLLGPSRLPLRALNFTQSQLYWETRVSSRGPVRPVMGFY